MTALVAWLTGCAPMPKPLDYAAEPRLIEIEGAFSSVIIELQSESGDDWETWWTGNMVVYFSGKRRRGLCFQWQAEVYRRITPRVRELGMETAGVCLDRGRRTEHHAVLLYDPLVLRDIVALPSMPPPRPAWVLDAWARGRADIYQLDDWYETHGRGVMEVGEVLGENLRPIVVPR